MTFEFRGPLLRTSLLVCTFGLAFSGCAGFKQSLDDCSQTSKNIQAELGVPAQCGFRTVNGHTSVTIKLATTPAGEASAIKAQVTSIVNRTFHGKVENVDVAL